MSIVEVWVVREEGDEPWPIGWSTLNEAHEAVNRWWESKVVTDSCRGTRLATDGSGGCVASCAPDCCNGFYESGQLPGGWIGAGDSIVAEGRADFPTHQDRDDEDSPVIGRHMGVISRLYLTRVRIVP